MLCHVLVESRENEYKAVIQELIEKEQSLKDEIQDKDADNVRLRKQIGKIYRPTLVIMIHSAQLWNCAAYLANIPDCWTGYMMLPYISDVSVVWRPLGRLKTSSATHSLMPETSILVVTGAKTCNPQKYFCLITIMINLSIILVSTFHHFEFRSSKLSSICANFSFNIQLDRGES